MTLAKGSEAVPLWVPRPSALQCAARLPWPLPSSRTARKMIERWTKLERKEKRCLNSLEFASQTFHLMSLMSSTFSCCNHAAFLCIARHGCIFLNRKHM